MYTCVEMVNTSASSSLYCRVLYIVPYLVRSVRAFEVMCIRGVSFPLAVSGVIDFTGD